MSDTLIPCESCSRHVRASEPACPFCGARLGLDGQDSRAAKPLPVVPPERIMAPAYGLPSRQTPMMQTMYGGPPYMGRRRRQRALLWGALALLALGAGVVFLLTR